MQLKLTTEETQATRDNNWFNEDVWPAVRLGLFPQKHNQHFSLLFHGFEQDWLKECCKKFIRYSASTKRFNTLSTYITSLRHFSCFLHQHVPNARAHVFSRELIIAYIHYLSESGAGSVTRHQRLILLRTFLETASLNGWLEVPPYLIRAEDLPKSEKSAPRFIPEEVMRQLNQHLDRLPPPMMRLVLVLQETGVRIGEILQLPIDCIEQDTKGGWFLRYTNWKMRREQMIPISTELAAVVQEQQEYIRSVFALTPFTAISRCV